MFTGVTTPILACRYQPHKHLKPLVDLQFGSTLDKPSMITVLPFVEPPLMLFHHKNLNHQILQLDEVHHNRCHIDDQPLKNKKNMFNNYLVISLYNV